jgi:hypothetical protein
MKPGVCAFGVGRITRDLRQCPDRRRRPDAEPPPRHPLVLVGASPCGCPRPGPSGSRDEPGPGTRRRPEIQDRAGTGACPYLNDWYGAHSTVSSRQPFATHAFPSALFDQDGRCLSAACPPHDSPAVSSRPRSVRGGAHLPTVTRYSAGATASWAAAARPRNRTHPSLG